MSDNVLDFEEQKGKFVHDKKEKKAAEVKKQFDKAMGWDKPKKTKNKKKKKNKNKKKK